MAKLHDLFGNKSGGQRHLRVGEELRHAIADIFMRGECHALEHTGLSITVSEVRVSPDLKNATVYVMPLAGEHQDELIDLLKPLAPEIRHLVSKKVNLRYMPKLFFSLDTSYDEAQRIAKLLKQPEVQRDIKEEPHQ